MSYSASCYEQLILPATRRAIWIVLPQPSARILEGLHLAAETETIESKCEIEVAIGNKKQGGTWQQCQKRWAGFMPRGLCIQHYNHLTRCHVPSVFPLIYIYRESPNPLQVCAFQANLFLSSMTNHKIY
jgi:hypothetical protein